MSEKRARQQQRRRQRKAAGPSKSAASRQAPLPARHTFPRSILHTRTRSRTCSGGGRGACRRSGSGSSTMRSTPSCGRPRSPARGTSDPARLRRRCPSPVRQRARRCTRAGRGLGRTRGAAGAGRCRRGFVRNPGTGGRRSVKALAACRPPWVEVLGRARPVAALMMCDDLFDDGVSILIEFARPNADPHTLGLYIDHNMGGIVKDAFVAGPLAEVRERFPDLCELDLGEARARLERALDILDYTLDPPVDEGVDRLRGFMYACARLLPGGAVLPDELEESAQGGDARPGRGPGEVWASEEVRDGRTGGRRRPDRHRRAQRVRRAPQRGPGRVASRVDTPVTAPARSCSPNAISSVLPASEV